MNEMTKMIVVFVAGVVIGVLGATSSIFQGDPEPAPLQTVPNEPAARAAGPAGDQAGSNNAPAPLAVAPTPAPIDPPATETEASGEEVAEVQSDAEADDAPAESSTTSADGEEEMAEADEPMLEADDDAEPVFCMQLENTGECRCYETDTMEQTDVSAEECIARLEEE